MRKRGNSKRDEEGGNGQRDEGGGGDRRQKEGKVNSDGQWGMDRGMYEEDLDRRRENIGESEVHIQNVDTD